MTETMLDHLSATDLAALIRRAVSGTLTDVTDLEVTSVHSALLTSFGLRAVRLAKRAKAAGGFPCVEVFESGRGFDFAELPKADLIGQLEAASGLGFDVCGGLVSEFERELGERVSDYGAVAVEGLGVFERHQVQGFRLTLDDDLRIGPPKVRARGDAVAA